MTVLSSNVVGFLESSSGLLTSGGLQVDNGVQITDLFIGIVVCSTSAHCELCQSLCPFYPGFPLPASTGPHLLCFHGDSSLLPTCVLFIKSMSWDIDPFRVFFFFFALNYCFLYPENTLSKYIYIYITTFEVLYLNPPPVPVVRFRTPCTNTWEML